MDGIIRLRLPLPYSPSAMVNAFLLERAGGGWCLVDCGTSIAPGWSALERALDLAGVETSAIELLVCTHAHADHYGLASEVMERSGCPLALAPGPTASAEVLRDHDHPARAPARAGAARRRPRPSCSLAAVSHPGDDGHHPRPAPDLVLDEGVGDRDARRPLACRSGAGTLADPGDAVRRPRAGCCSPPTSCSRRAIPYAEHDYTPDPWAEHVASLERARRSEPRPCSCPGTERPTRMPPRGSAKALDATAGAEERVHAVIATAPRSTWEIVEEILGPDAPFYPRQAGLSGATCLLEHLVRIGSAAAEDAGATACAGSRAL